MKILVINTGSSSIKYELFDMANESVLARGKVERIGESQGLLTHQYFPDASRILEKKERYYLMLRFSVLKMNSKDVQKK